MDKVLWKPIEGYEGLYEVSSEGRVRSLNYGGVKGKVGELSPDLSRGYYRVTLFKEGIRERYLVHRLVAEAFIENPKGLAEVNHRDEVKLNNRVNNLEWCSRSYNLKYGTRIKRIAQSNRNGKLSKPIEAVDLISGKVIHWFPSVNEAGRQGFNSGNINSCCQGRLKTSQGFIWRYAQL